MFVRVRFRAKRTRPPRITYWSMASAVFVESSFSGRATRSTSTLGGTPVESTPERVCTSYRSFIASRSGCMASMDGSPCPCNTPRTDFSSCVNFRIVLAIRYSSDEPGSTNGMTSRWSWY
jgi:hypothetical protein